MANRDFRRAVAYCLDKQALVELATNGAAFPQEAYVNADHPLWPGAANVTIYPYDPARGQALLDSLGWTVGADGIHRPRRR
jgi:ABC-type transport system substrate-binding protein